MSDHKGSLAPYSTSLNLSYGMGLTSVTFLMKSCQRENMDVQVCDISECEPLTLLAFTPFGIRGLCKAPKGLPHVRKHEQALPLERLQGFHQLILLQLCLDAH